MQLFDSWVGSSGPTTIARYVLPHTARVIAPLTPGVPVIHFGTGNRARCSQLLREAGGDVIGLDWRVRARRRLAAARPRRRRSRATSIRRRCSVPTRPRSGAGRRQSSRRPPAGRATSSTSATACCPAPPSTTSALSSTPSTSSPGDEPSGGSCRGSGHRGPGPPAALARSAGGAASPGQARQNVTRLRVVVVGGGIAGLAAAHRLVELAAARGRPLDLVLLEAADRLGGHDPHRAGRRLPARGGRGLVHLGEAVGARPRGADRTRAPAPSDGRSLRRTYVVRGGRLRPLPEGFLLLAPTRVWPVLASGVFSWRGKLRLGLDLVLPRRRPPGTRASGASSGAGSAARRSNGSRSPSSAGSTRRIPTACPSGRPCRASSRSSGSTGA